MKRWHFSLIGPRAARVSKRDLLPATPPGKRLTVRKWPLVLIGSLALLVLAGCRTRPPEVDSRPAARLSRLSDFGPTSVRTDFQKDWLEVPTDLFRLGPGDRVDLEIVNDPLSRTSTVVAPDGKLYFYLLPGLDVWGLTLEEARELIERELQRYIRTESQVSISLREVASQRVWLLGRLMEPGVYPMTAPMTVLEAISLAGGPAYLPSMMTVGTGGGAATQVAMAGGGMGFGGADSIADLRRSFVIRQGKLMPVDFHRLLREGDMSQNIYLRGGDFVYLPSATVREVYVLGAVAMPRAIPVRGPTTLISAIATAGGTIADAHLSHVAVVRGSLTSPQIVVVDFKDVVRGKVSDVLLEPNDIVYVPQTPYRNLVRYANLIVNTFVRTISINEGARAVSRGSTPVTPNVPIPIVPIVP